MIEDAPQSSGDPSGSNRSRRRRTANRAFFALLVLVLIGAAAVFAHDVCNPVFGSMHIVSSKGICGPINEAPDAVRSAGRALLLSIGPPDPVLAEQPCPPPWTDAEILTGLLFTRSFQGGDLTMSAARTPDGFVVRWGGDRDDLGPHNEEATYRDRLGPAEAMLSIDEVQPLIAAASSDLSCATGLPEPSFTHAGPAARLRLALKSGAPIDATLAPWQTPNPARVSQASFAGVQWTGELAAATTRLVNSAMTAGPPEGRRWVTVARRERQRSRRPAPVGAGTSPPAPEPPHRVEVSTDLPEELVRGLTTFGPAQPELLRCYAAVSAGGKAESAGRSEQGLALTLRARSHPTRFWVVAAEEYPPGLRYLADCAVGAIRTELVLATGWPRGTGGPSEFGVTVRFFEKPTG